MQRALFFISAYHYKYGNTVGRCYIPKCTVKWPKLRAYAEMDSAWSNMSCKPIHSDTLQTLADNELFICKNTLPRFTLKHAQHIYLFNYFTAFDHASLRTVTIFPLVVNWGKVNAMCLCLALGPQLAERPNPQSGSLFPLRTPSLALIWFLVYLAIKGKNPNNALALPWLQHVLLGLESANTFTHNSLAKLPSAVTWGC